MQIEFEYYLPEMEENLKTIIQRCVSILNLSFRQIKDIYFTVVVRFCSVKSMNVDQIKYFNYIEGKSVFKMKRRKFCCMKINRNKIKINENK